MATVIVMLGIAALAVYTGTAIVWAIAGNMRQGEVYRRGMAERLEALRLGRALTLLGVDSARYLHTQRAIDIEAHMRACASCGDLKRCDETLNGQGSPEDLAEFCPNEAALSDLAKAQAAERAPS